MRLNQFFITITVFILMMAVVGSICPVCANIVVFMDNSGSIRDYKKVFHKHINEIFKMAEANQKTITFVPIGDQTFQYARTREEAKRIFTFDNSYTYIGETLIAAKKNSVVSKSTKSIVIISDMEPDITNTPADGQLLSVDYQDILKWYHTLIDWMEMDTNIHIMVLNQNMPTFNPKDLKRTLIENELQTLIDRARKQKNYEDKIKVEDPGRPKTVTYIRTPEFNQKMIARVVKSLPLALIDNKSKDSTKRFVHYYNMPMEKKDEIMSIMEGIIDPSVIKEYKVKIEFDPNVVNLHRPEQQFVRENIDLLAPDNLNSNPRRKAIYRIVNDIQGPHDDKYHYHYRIMRGSIPGMMNIYLTNKAVTSDGDQYQMKEPGRFKTSLTYTDLNHLTQQILDALNQLKNYQEKDFPIGEKKVLIVFNTPKKYLLRGHRLTATIDVKLSSQNNSPVTQTTPRKDQSSIIQKDGQCYLKVRKQTDSNLNLILTSYENPQKPNEVHVPLATIRSEMLRSSDPIEINAIPKLFEKMVEIKSDPPTLEGQIKIIPYDHSEYFEIYTIKLPLDSSQSLKALLPGSYYYSVLFSSANRSCLNNWLIPYHIKDNRGYPITVKCSYDRFFDSKEAFDAFDEIIPEIRKSIDPKAPAPKLGMHELTGIFEAHLTGSPFFFTRLLEYTAKNSPAPTNVTIRELWRRIHFRLFKSHIYAKSILPKMLKPALVELEFSYRNNELIKGADVYLKTLLEKYFKKRVFISFSHEERDIFNSEILDAIKDKLKLPDNFVNQLSF